MVLSIGIVVVVVVVGILCVVWSLLIQVFVVVVIEARTFNLVI